MRPSREASWAVSVERAVQRVVALGALSALAAACPLPTGHTICADDDDCPSGFRCASYASYCVRAEVEDAGPADAAELLDAASTDRGPHDRRIDDARRSDA